MYLLTQGYRHCKAFLVGPGPMESTVSDFWRMIWEKQSFAIVMLGQLVENGEVKSMYLSFTHVRI